MRARFGFSDLVTALLPLGCTVLLYRGGEMPLEEYLTMGYDRDLLLGVRVPLDGIASAAYGSARNSEQGPSGAHLRGCSAPGGLLPC